VKYLSLNTHSWMEKNPLEKLKQTADFIIAHEIDIIALQEVNQLIDSEKILPDDFFCSLKEDKTAIKEDNYALLLVTYLKEKGYNYYWSWSCSHIGYDIYDEGVALLSKFPFKAETLLVSPTESLSDYHTRQILLAHINQNDFDLTVASCHFSWWTEKSDEGFYYEWKKLLQKVNQLSNQVLLLGDFNTPSYIKDEGYSLVTKTFFDCYDLAQEKNGSITVLKEIDGWKGNAEQLRIDFGFVLEPVDVILYQVVFNDKMGPIVSDHFGIVIEINS